MSATVVGAGRFDINETTLGVGKSDKRNIASGSVNRG